VGLLAVVACDDCLVGLLAVNTCEDLFGGSSCCCFV
jgi:hypothetical protein